jgi:hypothetical protein
MPSLLALLFAALLLPAPSAAAPPLDPADVPDALLPWVPWVRSRHAALPCAVAASGAVCRWPSRLELAVDATSAVFALDVRLDAPGVVRLPGGLGAWPAEVSVDPIGGALRSPWAVIEAQGSPEIALPAGAYRVRGRLGWTARPASLAVPSDVGVIALTVDGARVDRPALDTDGRLRLVEGEAGSASDSRLEIDVSRRISDGVPVVVTTRIDLRASGAARELDLGVVAVPGTVPVALEADVPARFDRGGRLIALVRPGSWTITFDARHEGPVAALRAPSVGEPWPPVEYWAWVPADAVRAATPAGPPGVDPSRTTLPEDWRRYAAFRVTPDTALTVEELRRGEPEPPPNELRLSRELWPDLDGRGWTVRDTFAGTMRRGWRLDAQAPLELGRVAVDGDGQVVTVDADGAAGVELRAGNVNLVADSRVQVGASVLPAVGWSTEARALDVALRLPPGWELVAAMGVDRVGVGGVEASWVGRWNLWDLFFVLVVGIATWRVLGWRAGLAALLALALGRHEAGAPAWIWAFLLATIALARGVPWPWARTAGRLTTWGLLVILALMLVPWSVTHLREGVWPATAAEPSGFNRYLDRFAQVAEMSAPASYDAAEEASGGRYDEPRSRSAERKVESKSKDLALQYDPGASIQTGPGVPEWEWRRYELSWNGAVPADHQLRLVLLRPWQTAALAAIRVGLFLLLGFAFAAAARRLTTGGPGAVAREAAPLTGAASGAVVAVVVAAALLASAPAAHAQPPAPDPTALAELEARILAAPACRPRCVTVADASVQARAGRLQVSATVHAADASSWPIPGPAATWAPSSVTIGGQPAAVARLGDGHLHVRVPPGQHRIEVDGPLPGGDALTLTWGLRPQRLSFAGDGWSFEGRRADGSADAFVQLTRTVRDGAAEVQRADELAPWVEVERFVDLGVPWRVQTTVRRLGPTAQPLALRVPLLDGEAVNDADYEGEGGERLVTFGRGAEVASWTSTLATAEAIALRAPEGVPWVESWKIRCSPVFQCTFDGPPPVAHAPFGSWEPRFRPWPGEQVTIAVSRPAGADGVTTTIDTAKHTIEPGRRQVGGLLELTIRTTRGGTQVLTLPEGARLTTASVGGRPQPLQLRDDRTLHVPLQPGVQRIAIAYVQDTATGAWFRAPEIDLGGPAVDVRVEVAAPDERWIVLLSGPGWGPTPLYIVYLILVMVGATILARLPGTPLAWWQWALLGVGMTQVPPFVPLVVAGWLFALAWRGRRPIAEPAVFNLVQVLLVAYTLVALGCLYAAVHAGLLFDPDMQITGNGSTNWRMLWYVDRIDGALPRPAVLSLPLWVWRVVMLLWALWLAASLIGWLRRGFTALGTGGFVKAMALEAYGLGAAPRRRPAVERGGAAAEAPEEPLGDEKTDES